MKQKTKKRIKKTIDSIAEDFTKTRPLLALGSFIMVSFFVLLFSVSWTGITGDLFDGYFEMIVILFLLYISFNVSNFSISNNGYLGLANGIYLFFGIVAAVSTEASLISLGANIVKIIWILTIASFIYVYINQNWEGWKQWALKFRKQ